MVFYLVQQYIFFIKLLDYMLWSCFVGNTGVAVMLYDPRRSNVSKIEREAGVKFEHVSDRWMRLLKLLVEKLLKWLLKCLIGMFVIFLFICSILSFVVNICAMNAVWFPHSNLLLRSFWITLVYQLLNYLQKLLPRLLWVQCSSPFSLLIRISSIWNSRFSPRIWMHFLLVKFKDSRSILKFLLLSMNWVL